MPEMPEVENVRRGVLKRFRNSTVLGVGRGQHKLRKDFDDPTPLLGQHLVKINRRGKYLFFVFTDWVMMSHLGMSGAWTHVTPQGSVPKHTILVLTMKTESGAEFRLCYSDPRRFGMLALFRREIAGKWIAKELGLGVEPLGDRLTPEYLLEAMKSYRSDLKNFLLDQHIVAGIGNIYASEIAFRVGVNPAAKVKDCASKKMAKNLCSAIRDILTKAVEHGGSTIYSYQNAEGESGKAQNLHRVYGRTGKPCVHCHRKIVEITQGGRKSFYCPSCQPL